ncbi:MAG TPA: NAD-dependent epimerase/dehydratase family protein [Candidatus Ozemobacteraceae bacterium]|nr:NAD-dependent epimerase/dehydratase family protein [Candidatus Ozemobacteraceae bacterium]
MKLLLTGATGFIGETLVPCLLREGMSVSALVRSPDCRLPTGVNRIHGDILDPDLEAKLPPGIDGLVHMAALITFDASRLNDLMMVNGEGTRRLLAAAERVGIRRVTVVSSACTLGISEDPAKILDESSVPAAALVNRNPYMASKLEEEKAALECQKRGRCEVVIVNPTTVFGAGDRTMNSGTMIRKVHGSRIVPLPPGGTNVVDVRDACAGILSAHLNGTPGRRYVLGGVNLTFAGLVREIAGQFPGRRLLVPVPRFARWFVSVGASVAARCAGGRFLTPQILEDLFLYKYYSHALAERDLGYRPRFGIGETLRSAIEYYRREGLLP